MISLGFLRRLRIHRGLSLQQAASDIGVSASALSMIERGLRAGSENGLLRLAQLYGADPDAVQLAGGRVPRWVAATLRDEPEAAASGAADRFSAYVRRKYPPPLDSSPRNTK